MNNINQFQRNNQSSLSMYDFDEAAYKIFLMLQQDPTLAIKTIADNLGYSTTLVKSRIDKLKEMEFLRPDKEILVPFTGKRLQTESEAIYDPSPLGLQRISVVLRQIKNMETIKKLETLLAIYPYSHYHVAAFGVYSSLYCQVDIPDNGKTNLIFLLDHIVELGLIDSYSLLTHSITVESTFDFDRWLLGSNRWKIFSENEQTETSFRTELDFLWEEFLATTHVSEIPAQDETQPIHFDHIDLKLLRELTINAKPNITDLSKHYEISRSRISRRISKIRDQVARKNQLIYDKSIFDLTIAEVISAKFRSDSPLNLINLYNFVSGGYIPFTTSVVIEKDRFLWYVVCPPSFLPMINRFVWQHADVEDILHLDLDTSRRYYFFHHNYDQRTGWKMNEDYMVGNVLDALEEIESNANH